MLMQLNNATLACFLREAAVIIGRWMSTCKKIMAIGKTVLFPLVVKFCDHLDPVAG